MAPSALTIVTGPTPISTRPMREAAPRDRSMTRVRFCGSRSVMVTVTLWPVVSDVTRTTLPSGNEVWAAVIARASNTLPSLDRRP